MPAPSAPTDRTALRLAAARAQTGRPELMRCAGYAAPSSAGEWNHELPAATVELVLELDGEWEVELDGTAVRTQAFVGGPIAAPIRTRSTGPTRLVQLSLDPLAVPTLLGLPAGAIAREVIDVRAVFGTPGDELLERLDDAWTEGGPNAATAAARVWLTQRRAAAAPSVTAPPADVRFALALLEASPAHLPIGALAAEVGCSRRHLARRFDEWVGTSPSEHQRLLRLGRATDALRADPAAQLGHTAAAAGYADQSHMVRDFRALTGRTPSGVARQFAAATAGH